MRVLITGITGFVATHLVHRLQSDGDAVFGTTRGVAPPPVSIPRDHVCTVELSDRVGLTEVVRRVRPDTVYHLAGVTSVPAAFKDSDETYRANLLGSLNMFAAVRDAGAACRIVWIGSGEAYGAAAESAPITEDHLFRPLSPYAVSKAAADLAAFQWSRTEGLDIVRVRPFNHTGPGQAAHFVCADFARQIVEIERGRRPARIDVGNLERVRDFSDVRDIVAAYVLASERGVGGEAYNACSGNGRTIRSVLDALISLSGVHVEVAVRPEKQRPVDVPVLIGSAAKLQRATGWSPVVSWEQTLNDVLDDWRARVS